MKKLTSYSKRVKYTYVKTTLVTIFVSLFFLKGYTAFEKTGDVSADMVFRINYSFSDDTVKNIYF